MTMRVPWSEFFQQITSGLAIGSIFASLALALVLIYRTTEVVNFAQGEMATFTTYIAWSLMNHGLSYWPAFVLTLLIAFAGGVGIERVADQAGRAQAGDRDRDHDHRAADRDQRPHRLDLGSRGEGRRQSVPEQDRRRGRRRDLDQDIGTFCVCIVSVLVLWAFFRFTTLGLAMRAVAVNTGASRLMGVRVGWMLALGWGFAAALGAIAGLMAAPTAFLDPNMMLVIIVYAFAAAVLGGIDSPIGAVVGGLILGVTVNLLGRYVDLVGEELKLPTALAVLLLVLVIRPQGLFGRVIVRRV